MNWKNFKASDFQFTFLHRFRFCRKPSNQWITFRLHLPKNVTFFARFELFKKAWFWLYILTACEFLNEKSYKAWGFALKTSNVSVFERNVLQRYRFWTEIFTTVQILNRDFYRWFWIKVYPLFQILQKTMRSRNHVLFRCDLYKWEVFADFVCLQVWFCIWKIHRVRFWF